MTFAWSSTKTLVTPSAFEPMPDIEAERDQHDILAWEMEPGDVLIHHSLTVHWAPGNLTAGRRRGLALLAYMYCPGFRCYTHLLCYIKNTVSNYSTHPSHLQVRCDQAVVDK